MITWADVGLGAEFCLYMSGILKIKCLIIYYF